MRVIRLKLVTFYQAVSVACIYDKVRRTTNMHTLHDSQNEMILKDLKACYIPELSLVRIYGDNIENEVYVGMANVKCFHAYESVLEPVNVSGDGNDDGSQDIETESEEESESKNLADKPMENWSDEDKKAFFFGAIEKATGKAPHPNTGLPKLMKMYNQTLDGGK